MRDNINKIIDSLNENFIIISPTDTVFGLLANSYSIDAMKNLYKIKNRPVDKTFAIFIHPQYINQYTDLNYRNQKLFEKFTPGPVTFVVQNINHNLSHIELNGKIAIRIPQNKYLLEILDKYKKPLIATSANISGDKNPKTFDEINKMIINNPLTIIENFHDILKYKMSQIASSIFDISEDRINTIREGSVKIKEIYDFLKTFNL
jgi:tRNA threonylcarbamoyl adenosine modification protein (Sua5/YciO/YrdC/YwlC family)